MDKLYSIPVTVLYYEAGHGWRDGKDEPTVINDTGAEDNTHKHTHLMTEGRCKCAGTDTYEKVFRLKVVR